MMLYVAAFLTSAGYVALKSFQQLNVFHERYLLVVPTSVAMAAADVWIIHTAATNGLSGLGIVLSLGLGAGLGAVTAMALHRRFARPKEA